MARSASRNSSAPAFEVMAPPSKAAVTFRLPRLAKSKMSSALAEAFVAEELSLIQSPDAHIPREISGLALHRLIKHVRLQPFSGGLRLRIRRLHECIAASIAAPYLARRLFIWMT